MQAPQGSAVLSTVQLRAPGLHSRSSLSSDHAQVPLSHTPTCRTGTWLHAGCAANTLTLLQGTAPGPVCLHYAVASISPYVTARIKTITCSQRLHKRRHILINFVVCLSFFRHTTDDDLIIERLRQDGQSGTHSFLAQDGQDGSAAAGQDFSSAARYADGHCIVIRTNSIDHHGRTKVMPTSSQHDAFALN